LPALDISKILLLGGQFCKLSTTIAHLSEVFDEYLAKDSIHASTILIVKLHIQIHYSDDLNA
jgi:hypothetical protein